MDKGRAAHEYMVQHDHSARRGRSRPLGALFIAVVVAVATLTPTTAADAAGELFMDLDGTVAYARGQGSSMGSGDFEVVFWAAADDWSRSQRQVVLAKWPGTSDGNGMRVQFDTVGNLQLIVKDRNGADHVYNAGEEFLSQKPGVGRWYRIRFDASTSNGTKSGIRVWESKDPLGTAIKSITWGRTVVTELRPGTARPAHRSGAAWSVGARDRGLADPFVGRIGYVHFIPDGYWSDGLRPTVVLDFRARWRASTTNKDYDTWENAGSADIGWRMAGPNWAYSGDGGGGGGGDTTGWSSGASRTLRGTDNTAGAADFSQNGKILVVQQTAGGLEPHASLFHTLAGYSSWSRKFENKPQPTLQEVIESKNGESVALAPDGSRVFVAPEGNAGTEWGTVYSYAIDVRVSTNKVFTDGRERREYDAAALAKVKRGISGMWISRKNPGVHWFVVDHTWESPDGYTLFAIDAKNDKLLWRGEFDESDSSSTITDWRDVEDLTGYKADGRWYLEIWDNGTDEVYRFPEPALSLGQSLVSKRGLRPERIMEVHGGVVGSGNVEAMAYNAAEDAMYWVGPRGSDSSDSDTRREVRRVGGWSGRSHRAEPTSSLVGRIVNRPL